MKFTLLTQTALAISSITGAVANPTPDISIGSAIDKRADWYHALYLTNVQCFWGDDGKYYIDASVARGPAGHKTIQDTHSAMCDDYERLTGCGTNREF
ncbi:hypothetical protein FOVSG1_008542 [Fusarium oxysporum f. sp. vasinfectum]